MTENEQYQEALSFIRRFYKGTPVVGIVLGTGLGGLVAEIEVEREIAYNFIPHFPISTVESHFGKLIFGTLAGKPIVAMQGRFHYYEGYSMRQLTFPIRILKMLGIQTLLLSNAAGSMNPLVKKGELMMINDHINLLGHNPLIGTHDDSFGPRFPDMSQPYDLELMKTFSKLAKASGITVHSGVYVAVAGPSLETRAEYRFLRIIGADVVGMSTVPEVIVAHQMELKILAVSVITDECNPDQLHKVSIQEIIETANAAEPSLTLLLKQLVESLA
ncbi:MAG: purine-nucleoside phosphorylase [Sphingobacteriia bacterium]|nr:purine-nucleoside phosphorylase [Sphingobacteriia bacterium]